MRNCGHLCRLLAGLAAAWLLGAGLPAAAAPGPIKLVVEEAVIASPQPGLKIYVREKHPAGMKRFRPGRTLVFVHGATYPASTSFDLELGGLSWMDYIARRGFDVYLIDLPGYGRSTRPAAMDRPAEEGQPVETTAQAEWDHDTPPARSQGLFPRLTHAAWKQYVLIGEGAHTVMMEKNRMLLFQAVQHFLEEDAPR